jgi:hypothetical protein
VGRGEFSDGAGRTEEVCWNIGGAFSCRKIYPIIYLTPQAHDVV